MNLIGIEAKDAVGGRPVRKNRLRNGDSSGEGAGAPTRGRGECGGGGGVEIRRGLGEVRVIVSVSWRN